VIFHPLLSEEQQQPLSSSTDVDSETVLQALSLLQRPHKSSEMWAAEMQEENTPISTQESHGMIDEEATPH
jgi:hypothetical protein